MGCIPFIDWILYMANTYLTSEGFKKLQDELEHLRTSKRNEVANRLHEAMDGGELIENAEYEAAKNEQAFVEGRIQELDLILASARIIDDNGKHDVIQVGSKVTIKEEREVSTYTIVGAAEANPREGLISNESPIGKALLSHKPGDEVKVEAPGGTFTVTVKKVE
jgi:transcription elongation factor GreA